MEPELRFIISGESKLSDYQSLLESYAVELSQNRREGKALLSTPIIYIRQIGSIDPLRPFQIREECGTAFAPPNNSLVKDWADGLFTQVDESLKLRLLRHQPVSEVGRPLFTRWPFFVEHKLDVCFTFGDQWWQFTFTPGKTYQEREF